MRLGVGLRDALTAGEQIAAPSRQLSQFPGRLPEFGNGEHLIQEVCGHPPAALPRSAHRLTASALPCSLSSSETDESARLLSRRALRLDLIQIKASPLHASHGCASAPSFRVITNSDLDFVQFFFQPMKGVVTDLVVGAHRESGLSRRVESAAIDFAVLRARDTACVSTDPSVASRAVNPA